MTVLTGKCFPTNQPVKCGHAFVCRNQFAETCFGRFPLDTGVVADIVTNSCKFKSGNL